MAEKKNEVAKAQGKKELSFGDSLTKSLTEVKDALPRDLNLTRFVQNGIALLNSNENLIEFAKKNGAVQIRDGMVRAAYMNLDFMSKEAYLIPYGNNLDFRPSYKGDIKLAKKYSIRPVLDIYAKVVREGDEFEEGIDKGKPYINFKPKPFNTGKVIGAFAVCQFADGGMVYDSMNLDELAMARSKSKMSNSMPWKEFTTEMQKKTVIHRLCKNIELEFENPKQRELFDEDVAIETDTEKIVENEISENANSEEFIVDKYDDIDNHKSQNSQPEKVDGEVVNDEDLPDFMK